MLPELDSQMLQIVDLRVVTVDFFSCRVVFLVSFSSCLFMFSSLLICLVLLLFSLWFLVMNERFFLFLCLFVFLGLIAFSHFCCLPLFPLLLSTSVVYLVRTCNTGITYK